MPTPSPTSNRKLGIAFLGGLIVGISAIAVDLAVVSYNRELIHSTEAVERINIAMKEAATDVFATKIDYGPPARPEIITDQRIA